MVWARCRFALVAALAFSAGVIAPAAADDRDTSFTPPGIIIRSEMSAHHLVCTGAGFPTVLLEAGLGGNHLDWALVQPELSRFTRVCSYDRAGMGWSERSARPRTVVNINDEFHKLIAAAGIERPFVLVGHSFGGLAALHYARMHPEEVAGLVLLDATHPNQFHVFEEVGIKLPDPHAVVTRTPPAAAAYGLPAHLQRLAVHLAAAGQVRKLMIDEMEALPDNAETVRRDGYPRLPARVLIHGNREWDRLYPDGRMEDAWASMHGRLATALGAPPPIVARSSGHQIALDEPGVVVAAIRDLIRSLGDGSAAAAGR
jgi:pimeloyl-ACP methyl ester carboxylesterase